MLSEEDNEILCRVGPGTPMGNLMRQYWIPAIRSDELPAPDCPPVRVRLLGENLIAFRTTSGAVGLMQNACPHRGASMFFGRNEEEGLRCVYHGWKFDVDGRLRRHAVRAGREQLQDQGAAPSPTRRTSAAASSGPTWARARRRRRCPTSRPTCCAEGPSSISILHRAVQLDAGLGGRDGHRPRRLPALRRRPAPRTTSPARFDYYQCQQPRAASSASSRREYGTSYGAYRPAEDDTLLLAHRPHAVPVLRHDPDGRAGPATCASAPTCRWTTTTRCSGRSASRDRRRAAPRRAGSDRRAGRPGAALGREYLPKRHRLVRPLQHRRRTLANDYMIDREAQANWESYTGIRGHPPAGHGRDREHGPDLRPHHEHLGTTDQLIIRTRRRMHQRRARPCASTACRRPASTTRSSTASAPAR